MVSRPVRIHVISNPPGDPVSREISAATMKIPEPIIEPTTIIVPSNKPMARTKPRSLAALVDAMVCVVSLIWGCASHAGRVIRSFEQLKVLMRAGPRVGRAENIANHSHRISTCLKSFRCSLQRHSADSHDGFVRQRANLADEVRAHDRIGIRLRGRGKDWPHGYIVRRSRGGLLELLAVVCRDANEAVRSDDRPRSLNV